MEFYLLLVNWPSHLLVNMINQWGLCSGRLEMRGLRKRVQPEEGGWGLRNGPNSKKGGLRYGSGNKGGGGGYLPRHIPVLDIHVYVNSPLPLRVYDNMTEVHVCHYEPPLT